MAAPKRTKMEREENLIEIARLRRRGWSEMRIAKRFGLSQRVIHRDVCTILQRHLEAQIHERSLHVALLDSQYDEIIFEHWKSYQKSKKDHAKKVTEQSLRIPRDDEGNPNGPPEMEVTKITVTQEKRVPGAEHLIAIAKVLQAKRELHGLDAPKKVDVRKLSIPFDKLLEEVKNASPPDAIDRELADAKKIIEQEVNRNGNGNGSSGIH
jgi:hypothetical protein